MKYVNKMESKNTCNVKKGYYLKILTLETMKWLGSTKSIINTL